MKVVVQNYYDFITTDGYLFKSPQSDIGYNLLKPWNDLYKLGKEEGIDFYTPDQLTTLPHYPKEQVNVAIYLDVPRSRVPSKKSLLILYEPSFLIPENWEPVLHDSVDRVMTWNDTLVDNKKFFKSNFTAELTGVHHELSREQFFLRKPLVMMQTKKFSGYQFSLYNKRIEAIRFFERTAAGEFDLYGRNWEGFPSWRGAMTDKLETLRNYRFCVAYENCTDAPGYITEKLTDCLLAGVVPIYWGHPSVHAHIPKECFIDVRDFASYEDLLKFVRDIDYARYMEYIEAINQFIASDSSEQFKNEWFVKQILTHIKELTNA